MTKLMLALVFATALGSHAAAAPPPRPRADQRSSLVMLLSAYELQIQRAALDTVGPDVAELLLDIANHPKELARTRVRALAALALYPNEATFAYLRSLLHERTLLDTSFGAQARRQALRSLGRGFRDRAIDDIVELKDDADPLVRESVAWALGDAGSPRALPVLEAWLPHEPAIGVRDAIDRASAKLRGL